jgi:hypothetical protein
VNLLYGAFFEHHEPDKLIESLLDRLTTGRIEIDMIQFRGIEFRGVDNRLMALKLVQLGLSGVAMFGPDREVLQPSEVLRKNAILVERGSFVHLDNYKPEYLPIFSRDVLRRIAANDDFWESMVPADVAALIKRRAFFGYGRPGRD